MYTTKNVALTIVHKKNNVIRFIKAIEHDGFYTTTINIHEASVFTAIYSDRYTTTIEEKSARKLQSRLMNSNDFSKNWKLLATIIETSTRTTITLNRKPKKSKKSKNKKLKSPKLSKLERVKHIKSNNKTHVTVKEISGIKIEHTPKSSNNRFDINSYCTPPSDITYVTKR